MTPLELVGLVLLAFFALALPALGQSVRNWAEDDPAPDRDADFLARIDADREQ